MNDSTRGVRVHILWNRGDVCHVSVWLLRPVGLAEDSGREIEIDANKRPEEVTKYTCDPRTWSAHSMIEELTFGLNGR